MRVKKYNDYFNENISSKIGFTFEKDFDVDDEDLIVDDVLNIIADMVNDGFTSGTLNSETEPIYSGNWYITVDDDYNEDDDVYYHEVSKSIRNGSYQGFSPNYKLYITIK